MSSDADVGIRVCAASTDVALMSYNLGIVNTEPGKSNWNSKSARIKRDIHSAFSNRVAIRVLLISEFGNMMDCIDNCFSSGVTQWDGSRSYVVYNTKQFFEEILRELRLTTIEVYALPPYVALVDTTHWHVQTNEAKKPISDKPAFFVQMLILQHQETSQLLRVFNAHIPTSLVANKKPSRKLEIKENFIQNMCHIAIDNSENGKPCPPWVICGDLNVSSWQMSDIVRPFVEPGDTNCLSTSGWQEYIRISKDEQTKDARKADFAFSQGITLRHHASWVGIHKAQHATDVHDAVVVLGSINLQQTSELDFTRASLQDSRRHQGAECSSAGCSHLVRSWQAKNSSSKPPTRPSAVSSTGSTPFPFPFHGFTDIMATRPTRRVPSSTTPYSHATDDYGSAGVYSSDYSRNLNNNSSGASLEPEQEPDSFQRLLTDVDTQHEQLSDTSGATQPASTGGMTGGVSQPTVSDVMVTPVAGQTSNGSLHGRFVRGSSTMLEDSWSSTLSQPSPPSCMSTRSAALDQTESGLNPQDDQVSNNSGITDLATDGDQHSQFVPELYGIAVADSASSSALVAAAGCQSFDNTRRRIVNTSLSLEYVFREPPSLEIEDEEDAEVERKLDTTSYNSNSHPRAIDVSASVHPNAAIVIEQISEVADPENEEGQHELQAAAQKVMAWLRLSRDGHSILLPSEVLPKISYPIGMREKAIRAIAAQWNSYSFAEWQSWYNKRPLSEYHFKFALMMWKKEFYREGDHAEELAALWAENTRKSKTAARYKQHGNFNAYLRQTCLDRHLALALLKYPSWQLGNILTLLAEYFRSEDYKKERQRAHRLDPQNTEAMEEKRRQVDCKNKVQSLRYRYKQAKGRGDQHTCDQLQQELDQATLDHGYGRVISTGKLLKRHGPPPLE